MGYLMNETRQEGVEGSLEGDRLKQTPLNAVEASLKKKQQDVLDLHIHGMQDFLYFCINVLGYRKDEVVGYFDLVKPHKELCELMQGGKRSKLILMPRHSIKSHLITIGWVLWKLVRNPNLRVLIYSDSAKKAQGFLYGIKSHIEGKAPNSKFRELYPQWETSPHSGGVWNDSRIVVRARTHAQKEPSVDTGGIDSSKIGNHYDIIMFDDIVSDINTSTKEQMDKVYECYKKSLSLLKPKGEIVLVGTRWKFGDTYGRIIDDNKQSKDFDIFTRDAEQLDDDGRLLFEAIGLDKKFLDYQREKQGSVLYSALYRNNPVDDKTSIFKERDFMYYNYKNIDSDSMFITCTCDPAGEGADYTALTVVGMDAHRRMYVLDAVNRHLNPQGILSEILRLNYKWGFDRFAIERNFFRGMIEREIRQMVREHQSNPKFKPFSIHEIITSSKNRSFARVLALQPFHERKELYLPINGNLYSINMLSDVFAELAYQMLRYTAGGSRSAHDDLIVSLSLHTEIMSEGSRIVEEKVEVSKRSVAYLESQWVDNHNKMQRKLPLYKRKYMNKVLS